MVFKKKLSLFSRIQAIYRLPEQLEDLGDIKSRTLGLSKKYAPVNSVEELAERHIKPRSQRTKSLDLGCGSTPSNPFQARHVYGVDIIDLHARNIKQADLSVEPIPFNENSFNFCTAYDVIEHIPRIMYVEGKTRFPFIELMNEIFRVLEPGGLLLHRTPAFPSKEVFQDPTHVNIITEDTIPGYFCEPTNWANRLGYGFHGSFELLEQRWLEKSWLVGILRSNKQS